MVRQKDSCYATWPTPNREVNTYIDKNANACYSNVMANNTNNRFRNNVRMAAAFSAGTIAALAAGEIADSTKTVDCVVPIEDTIFQTQQKVKSAGGETAGATLVDKDGKPIDIVSRIKQEDLSPTVYEGEGLEVQVRDTVICETLGKIAVDSEK
ncbi:MAG: hypothetical protein QG628_731 [Patescibacteria group bacterium]|jgi:hypothetical protein|nr:hypothetical protein [Patescibacteria group bacterium]